MFGCWSETLIQCEQVSFIRSRISVSCSSVSTPHSNTKQILDNHHEQPLPETGLERIPQPAQPVARLVWLCYVRCAVDVIFPNCARRTIRCHAWDKCSHRVRVLSLFFAVFIRWRRRQRNSFVVAQSSNEDSHVAVCEVDKHGDCDGCLSGSVVCVGLRPLWAGLPDSRITVVSRISDSALAER